MSGALTKSTEVPRAERTGLGDDKVDDFLPAPFFHRTLLEVSSPEQNRTQVPAAWDMTYYPCCSPSLVLHLAPTGSATAQGVTPRASPSHVWRGQLGQRKWSPEETGGRDLGLGKPPLE